MYFWRTIHLYEFERFSKDELRFLTWLFSLGEDIEIVILPGNHDPELPSTLNMLCKDNVHLVNEGQYIWNHEGKSYIALHGDQFDLSLKEDKSYQDFLYWWEKRFREIDRAIDYWFSCRWQFILGKFSRHPYWLERLDNLSSKAIKFGKEKKHHCVFCGHVHQPSISTNEEAGVTYVNLGCWVDADPTLCVIDSNGVAIHQWSPEGKLIGTIHPAIY